MMLRCAPKSALSLMMTSRAGSPLEICIGFPHEPNVHLDGICRMAGMSQVPIWRSWQKWVCSCGLQPHPLEGIPTGAVKKLP